MADKNSEQNLHSGHRARVRAEFLDGGFVESTPSHKILELLLFYCIPRVDTNPIAHEMIAKFGSFAAVLDASPEELAEFKGMTMNGAVLLKSIMVAARRYIKEKSEERPSFKNIDDIGDFLLKRFLGINKEKVAVICLDGKGKYINFCFISDGDIASVGLSMREVMSVCIEHNARAVVLAHNHPSGIAIPSAADVAVTEMAADTLNMVGIHLIDHIILADNDFVSMSQSSEYAHIFSK